MSKSRPRPGSWIFFATGGATVVVVFWCAWLLCGHSSGAASSVTDPLLENSYATKDECFAVAITKRNQRDAVERKLGRVAERSTFVCLPEGADPLKARME
jgi:hypothetical protein